MHLEVLVEVAVVLRVAVHFAAFLDRFAERHGFRHRLDREHLAQHMLPGRQRLDRVPCMFVGTVGQYHGINVPSQEIVHFSMALDGQSSLGNFRPDPFQQGLVRFTDGNNFGMRISRQSTQGEVHSARRT